MAPDSSREPVRCIAAWLVPGGPPRPAMAYGVNRRYEIVTMTVQGSGTPRSHTLTYSPTGLSTGYMDPDGGLTTCSYDGAGQCTQQENPNGSATTTTYDARENTLLITHSGSRLAQDSYTWDPNGNPTRKQTLTGVTTWIYSARDELIAEWHELGSITTWTYDLRGNRTQQDQLQGAVRTLTVYEYDAANPKTKQTVGTAVTTVTHGANGNLAVRRTPTWPGARRPVPGTAPCSRTPTSPSTAPPGRWSGSSSTTATPPPWTASGASAAAPPSRFASPATAPPSP
jgi:YD repeat-containing protein